MAVPSLNDLKFWVGTLFTKDDWDYNFSQLVSWLADGNSDLVVNSVKAANGIDLDGAKLSNVGVATNGDEAINLDQALTILNRTSYYLPFSVASGKVDSNGEAAFIQKDSDTQVTVLAGSTNPDLVCISSDATIETVTSNTVLTVPATDGTYHVIKEKGASVALTSGSSGKVTVSNKFPSSQNIGDYFVDNSVNPFVGYKYTSGGWEETPFCYLGYVTVSSGTATVTTFSYNYNHFDAVNSLDSRKMTVNWAMPDYERGVSKVSNVTYQAATDGWLQVIAQANAENIINFEVVVGLTSSPTRLIAKSYNGTGKNDGASCFVPIPAGYYYYYGSNDSYGQTGIFYPCKGE